MIRYLITRLENGEWEVEEVHFQEPDTWRVISKSCFDTKQKARTHVAAHPENSLIPLSDEIALHKEMSGYAAVLKDQAETCKQANLKLTETNQEMMNEISVLKTSWRDQILRQIETLEKEDPALGARAYTIAVLRSLLNENM